VEFNVAGNWSLRRLFAKNPTAVSPNTESPASTEMMEVGDFTISPGERIARLQGQDLHLTSEEFEVLVFLTTHRQQFVTPRTMLATSWPRGGLHQTEFLKALIGLRQKIDTVSSGKQYLRTEPWVVYRFDPNCSLPN
jgi:DNA-binding response OmpR family regulator